jgi:hypothetical protein
LGSKQLRLQPPSCRESRQVARYKFAHLEDSRPADSMRARIKHSTPNCFLRSCAQDTVAHMQSGTAIHTCTHTPLAALSHPILQHHDAISSPTLTVHPAPSRSSL